MAADMNTDNIFTIDCNYLYEKYACAYLLLDGKSAAFIECNTNHAVPLLMAELKKHNIEPEQVEFVAVTHIHLDHAGGVSGLLKACPNAVCLAHPRAERHIQKPAKLISAVKKVYGEEEYSKMYGVIEPVEQNRIRAMNDRETIHLGKRKLEFIHTRGHAKHHFCILDHGSGGIFTGDSFGLAYPAVQDEGSLIFVSTSPTDYEPEEARISIQNILDSGADKAFLTHFGQFPDIILGAKLITDSALAMEEIYTDAKNMAETTDAIYTYCRRKVKDYFLALEKKSSKPFTDNQRKYLKLDIELNGDGIAFAAIKDRKKSGI
jgi:glyoxylase-like metal-dependent hydrolase (beta-lactamase superfamily II)